MKTKSVIYFGLLALVVAIGVLLSGCGKEERREPDTNPYVKEITVNPIQVETIETETILWENVEIETWD